MTTSHLYLLDTNVILALIRANALGQSIDARFGLRQASQRPLASIVSVAELRVLAEQKGWGPAKQDALANAVDNLVVVDISHPSVIDAYVAIDLVSQQHRDGARNMGKNDLWIAACAKAAGATLLTTDKDFAHLIPDHLRGEIISPGG